MDRFIDVLCRLFGLLMVVALALMVVMVFGNVVLRYGFNSAITVSEELSRWLFVWLTFLGAIVAVRARPPGHRHCWCRACRVPASRLCFVAAHVLMLYMCWLMVRARGSRPSSTGTPQVPSCRLRWPGSSLPACCSPWWPA